ncbi:MULTISPECIES: YchJ family protein [Parachlamydia]|uniref:YchJ family protein n=1 Tax=Parachlamydia TaxID=83551 RepID=UPI0024E2434E|nr:YchJ family metal-binding protein [Parachlamydia acanthamoebae]
MKLQCPCDSGKTYPDCCQILHEGAQANQALSLMRSRYSAYAYQKVAYIIQTTHPDNPSFLADSIQWAKEILIFCQNTQFKKLEIVDYLEGIDESIVTFVAHLNQNHSNEKLFEKSLFIKLNNQWTYRDALLTKFK